MGSLRERDREVAAVQELLDRRGRMLLIEGRAGLAAGCGGSRAVVGW